MVKYEYQIWKYFTVQCPLPPWKGILALSCRSHKSRKLFSVRAQILQFLVLYTKNKDDNIHKSEALKIVGKTKINSCRVSELNNPYKKV